MHYESFITNSEFRIGEYENCLQRIIEHTVKLQSDVEKISKTIEQNVMVKECWWDNTAEDFADWWNFKDSSSGIARLNKISTIAEELVEIVGANISKALIQADQTRVTANESSTIKTFANKGTYSQGIKNLTKSSFVTISGRCSKNDKLIAEPKKLNAMTKTIDSCFKDIDEQIEIIAKSITKYLIEGMGLKIDGFNASTLKTKVNNVKECSNDIQKHLSTQVNKAVKGVKETTEKVKTAGSTDVNKGNRVIMPDGGSFYVE